PLQRGKQVEQRGFAPPPHVHHFADRCRIAQGARQYLHQILYVDEIPGLSPVAENGNGRAGAEAIDEDAYHARIGRRRILARAVDVEKAKRRSGDRILLLIKEEIVLARELVRSVRRQRIRTRFLVDRKRRDV